MKNNVLVFSLLLLSTMAATIFSAAKRPAPEDVSAAKLRKTVGDAEAINNDLIRAIRRKDFKRARTLLIQDQDVNLIDWEDKNLWICICSDESEQSIEFFELLMCAKINVYKPTRGGDTPLHIAANQCAPGIVRLLIGKANLKSTNFRGETVLHALSQPIVSPVGPVIDEEEAGQEDAYQLWQRLEKLEQQKTAASRVSQDADVTSFKSKIDEIQTSLLRKRMEDLNRFQRPERTELAKLLIASGVNVNTRDNTGKKASDYYRFPGVEYNELEKIPTIKDAYRKLCAETTKPSAPADAGGAAAH